MKSSSHRNQSNTTPVRLSISSTAADRPLQASESVLLKKQPKSIKTRNYQINVTFLEVVNTDKAKIDAILHAPTLENSDSYHCQQSMWNVTFQITRKGVVGAKANEDSIKNHSLNY